MMPLERSLLRAFGLALLYLLASPIFLVRALISLWRDLQTVERIRPGVYPCPWCRAEIRLYAIATCPVCRQTTPGSVLRCTCGARFDTVTCPVCSCTVKVR